MENKLNITHLADFRGHAQPVYCLEAAPEKGRFFSAGGDRFIVSWNINEPDNGKVLAKLHYTIYCLKYLEEIDCLAAGTAEGGLHIINLQNGKEEYYLKIPGEPVFDICYVGTQHTLVISTAKGNVLFISTLHWKVQYTLPVSGEKIRSLQYNADKNILYAACSDNGVYIINMANRLIEQQFHAHTWACNVVYYDRDKQQLVTASRDAHIRLWDITAHYQLMLSIPAHHYAIYQIRSYNGLFATASRDKTIKIWDKNWQILHRIDHIKYPGHQRSVNSVIWLDAETLVSTGDDAQIKAWSIRKQADLPVYKSN